MGNTFYLKSGDTAPVLEATLEDGSGNPIDLTGASVQFNLRQARAGDLLIDNGMTIADASNGLVRYSWADGETDVNGRYRAEFIVTYGDGSIETFPNSGYHDVVITD